jgi:hypothetical protein
MKIFFTTLLLTPIILLAQNGASNAELNKKLDLILNKFGDLEKRVTAIESQNTKINQDLKAVEIKAEDAKTASVSNIFIPQNEIEKKSFISKLRFELDSNKVKTKGPWTKNESWVQIKKNLSEFKVRTTLGNPTAIKSSNNPRVSRIYHYVGDLNADGVLEEGYVHFYKGRSTFYKSPFE